MRKKLYLLSILLLTGLATKPQINQKGKFTVFFQLNKTFISLSNNYLMGDDGRKYTPYHMSSLDETFHYNVTGQELVISAVEIDSLEKLRGLIGSFNLDTLPAHRHLYSLQTLQARVTKNGGVPGGWKDVVKMPSIQDIFIYYTYNPIEFKNPNEFKTAYWILKDSLEVGDSLLVELRRNDGISLTKIHVKRIPLENRPFLMGQVHDDGTARDDVAFMQEQLLNIYSTFKSSFYEDWPSRLDNSNPAYTPGSHLAFYFREPPNATDSTFEYRVLGDSYKNTGWRNTRGLILIPSLQAGANYRLDVRYKDAPALWATRFFHVPPYWYQTLWFKIGAGISFVVICLFLFLILAYRRTRRNQEKRKLKMQSLYAQLNPHFVFNALGSIQGLMNDQQLERANQYLSGFAQLLRNSMVSTTKETVSLQTELKNLNNYIQLEILRFNFQYEWYVDPSLPLDIIEVPPLLAQPLIENAVKHGVSAKGIAGELNFRVVKEKQDILFSISDNGPGFDPSKSVDRHGIKLTRDRIELFNKHRRITLDIQSDARGTTVLLRFKNWLEND